MPYRLTAVLFMFTLLLHACVTSPGSDTDPDIPFTIVAFGDSTTAPRTVEGQALYVYADQLRDRLASDGVVAKVVNAGVPADSTARGRKRFEADVVAHQPDVVIIQFGLNDSAIDVHAGKQTPRVSEAQYRNNLAYFVDTLQQKGTNVILMTPNPMLWTPQLKEIYGKAPYDVTDRWGFNLLNKAYAQAVRDIALEKKVPLVDIYSCFYDYDQRDGKVTEDLLLDGMHPNATGHKIIAGFLWRELQQIR